MTTLLNWHNLGRVGEKVRGLILIKCSRMRPSGAVVYQGLLTADQCYECVTVMLATERSSTV